MKNPFRLRSLLSIAWVYSRAMQALGGPRARKIYVDEYLKPAPNAKILDLGCGPADILADLPSGVDYHGIDLSEEYVQAARRRHGERGHFKALPIGDVAIDEPGTFDLVMANGVLHHLDDATALKLLRVAREALKPEGRFVSFDGCYHQGQGWMARKLLEWDRGRFVRRREEYVGLASQVFAEVTAELRQNLLRIPYSHLLLCCRGTASGNG